MDCNCPIWIYGRVGNDFFPRQTTGFVDLADAEALRASLIAKTKSKSGNDRPLAECIEDYLAAHRHELRERTLAQHRLHLSRLRDYCARNGVFLNV